MSNTETNKNISKKIQKKTNPELSNLEVQHRFILPETTEELQFITDDEDRNEAYKVLSSYMDYYNVLESQMNEYSNYLEFIQSKDIVNSQQASIPKDDENEVTIMRDIDELKKELLELSLLNTTRLKVLEMFKITHHYHNRIYKQKDEAFLKSLEENTDLDLEVNKLIIEIKKKQNQIVDSQSQFYKEAEIARELMKQVKTKIEGELGLDGNTEIQNRVEKNFNKEHALKQRITLLQQILQGLILESNLDWFNDPKLREWIMDTDL